MTVRKFDIFLANLDPRFGTEPGKTRPVVVVQTDLLNDCHVSTVVCPITTRVNPKVDILRVHVGTKENGLRKRSDILVDQVRALDNRRFMKRLGVLNSRQREKLLENLRILILE